MFPMIKPGERLRVPMGFLMTAPTPLGGDPSTRENVIAWLNELQQHHYLTFQFLPNDLVEIIITPSNQRN